MTTTTPGELTLPEVPEQFRLHTHDADYDRVVNFPRVAAECAFYAQENKLSPQGRWRLYALLDEESLAVRDYFVGHASRYYFGCSLGAPEDLGHNAGQCVTDMLAWSDTAIFGRIDIHRLCALTHQLATLCDDHSVLLNREEQYFETLRELPITHSEQGYKPVWSDDLRALLGDDFSPGDGQGGGVVQIVVDEQRQVIFVGDRAIRVGGSEMFKAFSALWRNRPNSVNLHEISGRDGEDVAKDIRTFLRKNDLDDLAKALKNQRSVGYYFDLDRS